MVGMHCTGTQHAAQESKCLVSDEVRYFQEVGVVPAFHVEGSATQAFAEAVRTGDDESRQGRVVLLGDSRVGKTSTFRSLIGEPFNDREPSTVGLTEAVVDVHNVDVNCWQKQQGGGRTAYEKAALWCAARTDYQVYSTRSGGAQQRWPAVLAALVIITVALAVQSFGFALSSLSRVAVLCIAVFCLQATSNAVTVLLVPLLAATGCEVFIRSASGSEDLYELPYLPVLLSAVSLLWVAVNKCSAAVGCVWLLAQIALVTYSTDFGMPTSAQPPCTIYTLCACSLQNFVHSCAILVLLCGAFTLSTPGFCAGLCFMKFHWANLACVDLARNEPTRASGSFLLCAVGIALGFYLAKFTSWLAKWLFLSTWLGPLWRQSTVLLIAIVFARQLPSVLDACTALLQSFANIYGPPIQGTLFEACLALLPSNIVDTLVTPLLSGYIGSAVAAYSLPLIRIYFLDTQLICGTKISTLKQEEPAATYTGLMLSNTVVTVAILVSFRVDVCISRLTLGLAAGILLTGHMACLPRLAHRLFVAKPENRCGEKGVMRGELEKNRHHQLSVEFDQWRREGTNLPNFRLDFLDFAGHPLYESVHHVYLTANDIYLLVFNLKNAVEKGLDWQLERLTIWLSSILRQATWTGKGSTDILVLLVATHRDGANISQDWISKLCQNIDQQLGLHPVYGSMLARARNQPQPYVACIENSNRKGTAVSDLRKQVLEVMRFKRETQLSVTKIRWLYLSHCLRQEMNSELCCVPVATLKEMADRCFVDAQEFSMAVRRLHEIGELVYQPRGHGLSSDVVLLQPSILCSLLGHVQEIRGPKASKEWLNLRRTGLATRSMLEVLFKDIDVNLNLILGMLVAFRLVCPLRENFLQSCPEDRFLFPCYLSSLEGDLDQLWSESCGDLHEDEMFFDFGVLDPSPLFGQLLAVTLGAYVQSNPHIVDDAASNLRRTAAVLTITENEQLLLHCNTVSSSQHLIRLCSRRTTCFAGGASACVEVCEQLLDIQKSSFPHLHFHAGLMCPKPAPHGATSAGDLHILSMFSSASRGASWEDRKTSGQLWCRGRAVRLDELNQGKDCTADQDLMTVVKTVPSVTAEVVEFDNYLKRFISNRVQSTENVFKGSSSIPAGLLRLSDEYCRAIDENFVELSTKLPWREVLDHLVAEDVLTPLDDAYQYIAREGLIPNERRRQLLRFVCLSGDEVFMTFLKVLSNVSPCMVKACFGKILDHVETFPVTGIDSDKTRKITQTAITL